VTWRRGRRTGPFPRERPVDQRERFEDEFDELFEDEFELLFDELFEDEFDELFEDEFDELFDDEFELLFELEFEERFDDEFELEFDELFEDEFDERFELLFDERFELEFDERFELLFDDEFDELFDERFVARWVSSPDFTVLAGAVVTPAIGAAAWAAPAERIVAAASVLMVTLFTGASPNLGSELPMSRAAVRRTTAPGVYSPNSSPYELLTVRPADRRDRPCATACACVGAASVQLRRARPWIMWIGSNCHATGGATSLRPGRP
jgi:hypothetical protein